MRHIIEPLGKPGRFKRPDVAFSQGSYAQLFAAQLAGIPSVTMMDYEHQPGNHLSFRPTRRVIVPERKELAAASGHAEYVDTITIHSIAAAAAIPD